MNRIMIIGVSAGAGKSTFARILGINLGIDVYHLDTLFWKPGWVETSIEQFIKEQEELVKKNQWIIEGNYNSTIQIREDKCDTVIYLELPLLTCLYRVLKRRLMYIGKTRPDMTAGCKEKLDWKFIKFILTTYRSRKTKMSERIENYQAAGKKVVVLKSRGEISDYLNSLSGGEFSGRNYD